MDAVSLPPNNPLHFDIAAPQAMLRQLAEVARLRGAFRQGRGMIHRARTVLEAPVRSEGESVGYAESFLTVHRPGRPACGGGGVRGREAPSHPSRPGARAAPQGPELPAARAAR